MGYQKSVIVSAMRQLSDDWRRMAWPSHMSIVKRTEKRAIIPTALGGILKIVKSAISADWEERAEIKRWCGPFGLEGILGD